MNKIVIEFCPEDRKRIDELIDFAGLLVGELKSRGVPVCKELEAAASAPRMTQAEDGTVMLVKPDDHPADAPIAHLEPPAPAPEVKPVSLGEFQKAIVTRCAESPETKKKVRELIHTFAPSVGEVPENKRAEVLAALAKI